MRILLLRFISITIISCNNETITPTIQSNGQIVIIDSSGQTETLWTYDSDERYGYYPVYYIGKSIDTIRLGQRKIPGFRYGQKDYSKLKNFTWADSTKMRIIVDTSFSLTHRVYYTHYSEKEDKEIIDSTKSFKAYAIFVENLCDSLLSIGNFSELGFTIRQAKNEHGDWIDIETPISYFCVTGARDIVIEPNELIVAMLPRYRGDYKTECRLKHTRWPHSVYSNTFIDYIDKKQLTDTLKFEY
ncbi:MAG: hypothetical protein EAY81_05070 [Bacteroidetes bacterium]|nr:MAG: hypothetical protein EAY81_05070 [Bacteroidota bacterium]